MPTCAVVADYFPRRFELEPALGTGPGYSCPRRPASSGSGRARTPPGCRAHRRAGVPHRSRESGVNADRTRSAVGRRSDRVLPNGVACLPHGQDAQSGLSAELIVATVGAVDHPLLNTLRLPAEQRLVHAGELGGVRRATGQAMSPCAADRNTLIRALASVLERRRCSSCPMVMQTPSIHRCSHRGDLLRSRHRRKTRPVAPRPGHAARLAIRHASRRSADRRVRSN